MPTFSLSCTPLDKWGFLYNQSMNISEKIQALRRERNAQLLDAVEGNITVENLDDLFKLVGELECAYLHSRDDAENSRYCLLKHLACAYVLSGEVDGDTAILSEIIREVSGGIIYACKSCLERL